MNSTSRIISFSFYTVLFLNHAWANALNTKDEKVFLDELVVSASGFEQDADKNLRNVIVVDGSSLKKKGFSSIEQVLESIPEINFVNFGLGRNVDMRGQGNKSNIAVKVMLDGRQINMLDNSHGVTPLNGININNIERIEIIPGGGSILYGNGTRGGVINIISKKQKQDHFSIFSQTQSYQNIIDGGNFGFNLNKVLHDDVVLSLSAQKFDKNGFQEGYNEKGFHLNTGIMSDLNENSNIALNYNHFKSTNKNSGYLTKAQIESNPRQKGASENITQTNRSELSLDYNYYLGDAWEFRLGSFWQDQKIVYDKDVVMMKGIKAYQDGSGFNDTTLGFNFKAKYNYDENSYLVSGYDFLNHDAKRTSLLKYSVFPIIPYHHMQTIMDMNKQSHSVFVLNSHQLNDIFVLSSGIRYEWNQYTTHRSYKNQMQINTPNHPNSSVIIDELSLFDTKKHSDNIAFELTPTFVYSDTGLAYFKYERGFISPSPAQFVNKDNKSKKYYSTDLNSEIFHTFELGINDVLWDFHVFRASVFYTQSKDEIAYLGNPHATSGSWWKYYNIDETRRLGVEMNLSQKLLGETLILKQGVAYIDASISKGVNDGLRIPYVSKVNLYAGLDYYWSANFNTFVDLNYHSRSKDGGMIDEKTGKMYQNEWIKDYTLVDIGASYNYKNLQIAAGIRNVFDKKYYTYQDSINDQYLPGNGRSYYTEFKYVF